MKKFAKLFLSCAAVAAITAAVATSAMAADNLPLSKVERTPAGASGTYDTVQITIPATYTDTVKTILILPENYLDSNGKVDADKIIYVNQGMTVEDGKVTVPVKKFNDELEADQGKYLVLMGGDTTTALYEGTFRVGSKGMVYGEVDGKVSKNGPDTGDALAIIRYALGSKDLLTGDLLTAAEVDGKVSKNGPDTGDALCVIRYALGETDAKLIGLVGQEF